MESKLYEIESNQLFSKSKVWQFNRDYYQYMGMSAFSEDIVPHHLTSNSLVGKTYASLILGLLKDLALKGNIDETVYIVELGAGHGRLAYHILKHLEKVIAASNLVLPKYCYVLSDIAKENLAFFEAHPQLEAYYKKGILDVSYFDAVESEKLELRYSKKTIGVNELAQPLVAIANYFFDSIPNELFLIKDKTISSCSISIKSNKDPSGLNPEELIKSLELTHHNSILDLPTYKNELANEILEEYKHLVKDTYLYYPEPSMRCIANLNKLSKKGLFLVSMDKGFYEIPDLENRKVPDIVNHGSYSIWVNYHALGSYCQKQGGKTLFPSNSTFHLVLGTLMFMDNSDSYHNTLAAYQQHVDDFGPDDFNTIKHLSYHNSSRLNAQELIALLRLSAYDSTFFIKLLPRLKEVSKAVTFNERKRIAESMDNIWNMYFSIGETFDLPYEIGGLLYDLGFNNKALNYFQNSIKLHGDKPETLYNIALCYYQLRKDKMFHETLNKAKLIFPAYERFGDLTQLDMS